MFVECLVGVWLVFGGCLVGVAGRQVGHRLIHLYRSPGAEYTAKAQHRRSPGFSGHMDFRKHSLLFGYFLLLTGF